MTSEQIKARLKEKKLTQAKLAERFGVGETAITFLIRGTLKSKNLEKRLARALGVPVDEIRNRNQQVA